MQIDTVVAGAVAVATALVLATLDVQANPGRGQLLYEARCTNCHATSVHNRQTRIAKDFDGIRAQVKRWNEAISGDWTDKDVNDVTDFLNRRYYQYVCPEQYCNRV